MVQRIPTHWLVAFDITDNRTRTKLVKMLEKYGERVQYSVFEIVISTKQRSYLQNVVSQLIDLEDKVYYFPLCGKDKTQRATDGYGHFYEPKNYHLF